MMGRSVVWAIRKEVIAPSNILVHGLLSTAPRGRVGAIAVDRAIAICEHGASVSAIGLPNRRL